MPATCAPAAVGDEYHFFPVAAQLYLSDNLFTFPVDAGFFKGAVREVQPL